MHLPDLAIAFEPQPDDGPVLIQIEYQIDAENLERFINAIHGVERIRRRNGAQATGSSSAIWARRSIRRALSSSGPGPNTSGCEPG
jgi:hypothetical protein